MKIFSKLWRKTRREEGNATVEFVLVFPVFILLFVSIFELGLMTIRITVLESGLDKAMRDIRLGTSETYSRQDIRDRVCSYAGLLRECDKNLLMEMLVINRGNFVLPPGRAKCINRNENADPVTQFENGAPSDLMFIRACYVIEPLFPTFGMGASISKDPSGRVQLVASSIFAQEPN